MRVERREEKESPLNDYNLSGSLSNTMPSETFVSTRPVEGAWQ